MKCNVHDLEVMVFESQSSYMLLKVILLTKKLFIFSQISKSPSFGTGCYSNAQLSDLWQTAKPSCLGAQQVESC